jgi:hypothetical protein
LSLLVCWEPNEYAQYKRFALKKEIADEKLEAARAQEDAALDWGVWGPFW